MVLTAWTHKTHWSSRESVLTAQYHCNPTRTDKHGLWRLNVTDWAPYEADHVQSKRFVLVHDVVAGNRYVNAKYTSFRAEIRWIEIMKDVEYFKADCLLCVRASYKPPSTKTSGNYTACDHLQRSPAF